MLTALRDDVSVDPANMLCLSGLVTMGGELGGVACWAMFWVEPGGLLVGVITLVRAIGDVLRARGEGVPLELE